MSGPSDLPLQSSGDSLPQLELVGYGLPGCRACSVLRAALQCVRIDLTASPLQIRFEELSTLEDIRATGLGIPSFPFLILKDREVILGAWEGVERGQAATSVAHDVERAVTRAVEDYISAGQGRLMVPQPAGPTSN